VLGRRPLRTLRFEAEAARERVYDLFNSFNSNSEFHIHCSNAARTGTRITQRVCRPQFADNATRDAGRQFLGALFFECTPGGAAAQSTPFDNEACVQRVSGVAQTAVSEVGVKERQLANEVQRLAHENREFRRAIAEYHAAEARYEAARRAEESALRASVTVIATRGATAPSERAVREPAILAPQPVELTTPEVASRGGRADELREGWVKLRYSVLADGTTADVRVVDAMPAGLDPLSAVAAARTWMFEPATVDDEPIDWHNNLAVIVFDREPPGHEDPLPFAQAYEEVAELITSGIYEQAKSRSERMQREHAFTLEDIGLALMQRAALEHALGDPHAALDAVRRATQPEVVMLEDEELKIALEHRFALEIQLGRAVDALETYERRNTLERLRSRDPMARQAAALRQALQNPETSLAAQGRLNGDGQWVHTLTWGTVAVGDLDGHIENLEVECSRNKAALPFEADVELTIPETWGECALFVHGVPNTTITLYEFWEPM